MMKARRKFLLAAVAVPLALGIAGTAAGQASDYYKGKVVNLIIAGSPSGGHSRYARLIAPYLQKYLGASELRISNML